MSTIIQPITQKWLTNVSIVQYEANDQRFEVACYSNKIASYRNGAEIDINEVMQARAVFSDAVKGELQSFETLQSAFGTRNLDTICHYIIMNGRVQLSELERSVEQERKLTETAAIVALRLINPATGAAYPRSLIEAAIKNHLHYSVTTQPASAQAAHVIRRLEAFLGVQLPQKVQIMIEMPVSCVKECLEGCVAKYNLEINLATFILEGGACFFTAFVEISQYKPLCSFIKESAKGLAHISIKGTMSFKMK